MFLKKLLRFFPRLLDYLPVIWDDCDYDYGSTLELMMWKLDRLGKHIAKHDIIMEAEQIGKEIEEVKRLYSILDEGISIEEDEENWNNFFNYLRDNMRKWWD